MTTPDLSPDERKAMEAAKREPPEGTRGFEMTTQAGLLAALNYERGVEAGWLAAREFYRGPILTRVQRERDEAEAALAALSHVPPEQQEAATHDDARHVTWDLGRRTLCGKPVKGDPGDFYLSLGKAPRSDEGGAWCWTCLTLQDEVFAARPSVQQPSEAGPFIPAGRPGSPREPIPSAELMKLLGLQLPSEPTDEEERAAAKVLCVGEHCRFGWATPLRVPCPDCLRATRAALCAARKAGR